jgi:hypothetical protein
VVSYYSKRTEDALTVTLCLQRRRRASFVHTLMAISPDDASVILSSTLNPTKGIHTTSTIRFALRGSRAHSCTLHFYLTLPAQLFADSYELAHRHASYTVEEFDRGNLEAPVFASAASLCKQWNGEFEGRHKIGQSLFTLVSKRFMLPTGRAASAAR